MFYIYNNYVKHNYYDNYREYHSSQPIIINRMSEFNFYFGDV